MNIDDFRAMKAEMEKSEGADVDAQAESSTDGKTSSTSEKTEELSGTAQEESKPNETNQTEEPSEETLDTNTTKLPETIEIDGKEVPIEELKSGYMRQSDYTKKTQKARRLEQEAKQALELIEQIQKNPQYAKQLSKDLDTPILDPAQSQYTELENKYFDLFIEREIDKLTDKYGEFDVEEVLTTARDNNIEDLDMAYHVVQSRKGGGGSKETDIDSIKSQLRDELLAEIKQEQASNVDTSTIIQNGGDTAPTKSTAPELSSQEKKVALNMGLSPKEYAKWRDAK